MSHLQFRYTVRVYHEDTDTAGIVYHPQFISFMNRARVEWLRAKGISMQDFEQKGLLLPIRRIQIDYLRPAYIDQALEVYCELVEKRRVSMTFYHEIRAIEAPSLLLCKAEIQVTCVDRKTFRPCQWPNIAFFGSDFERTE